MDHCSDLIWQFLCTIFLWSQFMGTEIFSFHSYSLCGTTSLIKRVNKHCAYSKDNIENCKIAYAFCNWCGKRGRSNPIVPPLSHFSPFDGKQQILISFISMIQSCICNLCSHFYKVKLSERNWVIIESLSEQNKFELSNIRKDDWDYRAWSCTRFELVSLKQDCINIQWKRCWLSRYWYPLFIMYLDCLGVEITTECEEAA